ncbi:MAG: hypothetical protein AAF624_08005 [Bacteroidota bacterium]
MNPFDSPSASHPDSANVGPKTYAIILGTLALGMLLGAVITGFVVRQSERDMVPRMMVGHESIESAFADMIQPTEEQREAIQPILQEAQEGMIGNILFMRCRMRTHIDSVVVALESELTPEQVNRVRYVMQEQPDEVFSKRMPADMMRLIQSFESMGRPADQECVYQAPRIPLRLQGRP